MSAGNPWGWRQSGRVVWPNCTLRHVQAQTRTEQRWHELRRARREDADLEDFLGIIQTVGEALFRILHGSEALELEAPTIEARFTTKQ